MDGLQRVAMISLHTSPLDQPGIGDAGGMNVYVVELAKRLAPRGASRSTSSRVRRPRRCRQVVLAGDGVAVRHITAGPFEGLTKGELPGPAVRVRPRGAARRGGPAARPLRRRAQPLLALRPGRGARPRPLGRAARPLHAHHGQGQERRARRRRHPRARGPDHRRGAGGRGRRHAGRQHRPRGQAADQPVRRRPGPGRGGPPRRRPRRLPAPRPARRPAASSGCPRTPTCCCSPAGSSR